MVESVLAGEWRRAQECLGTAAVCRDNGFHADAVSRAYYAIMHGAKAALAHSIVTNVAAAADVLPDTHDGVINRFGLRLVRAGEVDPMWGAYLRQMHQKRISADYDVTVTLTDSVEAVERATFFLDRMHTLMVGDVH